MWAYRTTKKSKGIALIHFAKTDGVLTAEEASETPPARAAIHMSGSADVVGRF